MMSPRLNSVLRGELFMRTPREVLGDNILGEFRLTGRSSICE